LQAIRIRCPQCNKLYAVDPAEIKSAQPKFVCRECQAKFWFEFPPPEGSQDVVSHLGDPDEAPSQLAQPAHAEAPAKPLKPPTVRPSAPPPRTQEPAPPVSEPAPAPQPTAPPEEPKEQAIENKKTPGIDGFHCPNCGKKNSNGSTECLYCGVVFKKHEDKETGPKSKVSGNKLLEQSWQAVLDEYANEKRHESFIQLCLQENNLPFASQQYRLILEGNANDETAIKMRDKIINIATLTYVPPKRELPDKRRRFGISGIIMLVGFICIVLGLLNEALRQTIALGAAMIVAGFLIRFYVNKN
jgi:transcription elongation factor Elf1